MTSEQKTRISDLRKQLGACERRTREAARKLDEAKATMRQACAAYVEVQALADERELIAWEAAKGAVDLAEAILSESRAVELETARQLIEAYRGAIERAP
jgi:hypothetical protein